MTLRGSLYRGGAALLLLAPLTLAGCAGDDADPADDSTATDGTAGTAGTDGTDDIGGDDGGETGATMLEIGSQLVPTRARGTALHGNATGVHECPAAAYDHYEEVVEADAPQLHVVGIYGPQVDEQTGEALPVEVHLTRPGSSILVLGAYEAATWRVTTEADVTLEKVIVASYDPQEVTAPDGVPIERHGGDEGYVVPGFQWPSYQATDLADLGEELTGRTMTSFRGCYSGLRFQIDTPDEIRPPHPELDGTKPVALAGCEALMAESTVCMVDVISSLAMVGLDSGELCVGDPDSEPGASLGNSLGWQGSYVYACDMDRGIARTSVVDGTVDIAPVPCSATTSYDGGLLSLISFGEDPLGGLIQFDTFDAAARREPTRVFGLDPYTSRIAVQGNRAYFAWHSTDTVQTAELADGAPIKDILLEGYDDWIDGLDATGDGRLVIGMPWYDIGISLFDAHTGAFDGQLPTDFGGFERLEGLKCHSEGD